MSRRRPTFVTYMRRRWRAVGAIVVLLLGSLVVLGVTDRGHDPVWETRIGEIDQAAFAPDASIAYALTRSDQNVSGLLALGGHDGAILWQGPLQAPRAVLAASERGVAVATDFPLAFLTAYGADGSIRLQIPLNGTPVAMAMTGERIALALTAPDNPILVFDGDRLVRTYWLPTPTRALDMEMGWIAAGGPKGNVYVWLDDEEIVNVTLPLAVRSLRLSHDATTLIVGGAGLTPADTSGHVALLDVGSRQPVRWIQDTLASVGFVDVDAFGLRVLALEEEPPTTTLHMYDGADNQTLWTRTLPGNVARADSGSAGGAALAPEGGGVVVATLRGDLMMLDATDGAEVWSYRTGGAGFVAFANDEPRRVIAGARLLENRPFDTLLLFSLDGEPVDQRAPLIVGVILAAALTTFAVVIGLGFWRVRRPY